MPSSRSLLLKAQKPFSERAHDALISNVGIRMKVQEGIQHPGRRQ
jgi:hypothetical protein